MRKSTEPVRRATIDFREIAGFLGCHVQTAKALQHTDKLFPKSFRLSNRDNAPMLLDRAEFERWYAAKTGSSRAAA